MKTKRYKLLKSIIWVSEWTEVEFEIDEWLCWGLALWDNYTYIIYVGWKLNKNLIKLTDVIRIHPDFFEEID